MIRRYFIAGLLVWIPLWVTFFVIKVFVDFLDRSLALLPVAYRPDTLLGFHLPGLGLIISLIVIFLTGLLITNFLGRRLVALWDALLARIPLVRSLHAGVKQMLQTFFAPSGASFRKVLLIEYPRKGLWSIAFQTSVGLPQAERHAKKPLLNVFVPTTPNPTSGFLLMIPEKEAIVLDISVDAALKMVISLGMIAPEPIEDEKE